MTLLQLDLLGIAQLRSEADARVLERKDAALLAMLALDGARPRSLLAGWLWPGVAADAARRNLRQRLFRLHRLAQTDLVVADGDALALAPALPVDLRDLDARLAADAAACAGELLDGHAYDDLDDFDAWLAAARMQLRDRIASLLAGHAAALESRREVAAALPYAQRLVALDLLNEHAQRRLMRLHYLRGDRGAALAAGARCGAALHDALGTGICAETRALIATIESGATLPHAAPSLPAPITLLRPPRLVGREAAWAAIDAGLRGGRAALLIGEAGIGKSRLLADYAASHGGAEVFDARPGDRVLPYALLAALIRRLAGRYGTPPQPWCVRELSFLAPELAATPGGTLDATRLRLALEAALAHWSAAGLRLIAVDDLHDTDDASLDQLAGLATRLRSTSEPAWLLTTRAAEMPAGVRAWLDAASPAPPAACLLTPLDSTSIEALLASLAIPGLASGTWAPALLRHTGGNPLFVLETLRALAPGTADQVPAVLPAPARVGEVIAHRLGLASPAAQAVARVAALAGPDFSVEVAARLLGRTVVDLSDVWRELEASEIFAGTAFAHDLVAEAARRGVPQAIQASLHRQLAEALCGGAAPPARLAVHWERGGEPARAAGSYRAAAAEAFRIGRRSEELGFWRQAVACHERAGDAAAAFEARCLGTDAAIATLPLAEADALTEQLVADAPGDEARSRALLARTQVLLTSHRGAAARDCAAEAHALAQRLGLRWLGVDAARSLALSASQLGRGAEGVAVLDACREQVETEGSTAQRAGYWSDLSYVLHGVNRRRESAAAMAKAVEFHRAAGDALQVCVMTGNLTGVTAQLGDPEGAYRWAQQARQLLRDIDTGDGLMASVVELNHGNFAQALGRYDAAIESLERACAGLRRSGSPAWLAVSEQALALTWLRLGQHTRAAQALSRIEELPAASRPRHRTIEARIARAEGRATQALLQEALAALGPQADPMKRIQIELDISRELEPAAAAALCRRCRDEAEAVEVYALAQTARVLEVEARLRGGDAAGAAAEADRIAPTLRQCVPLDLYWPEALWTLARAEGRQASALRHQARRWIVEVLEHHVPAPFVDSFRHRQPVNRAVLAGRD